MASNRQERLQMRQRGAGTRKIKDVDFGFSFGSPGLSQPQLARRSPRLSPPNPSDGPKIAEVQRTPLEQQVFSPKGTPLELRRTGEDEQTPIHSRNGLPERPSTFDIPPDDVPEEGRSSKRRKLREFETIPEDEYIGSPGHAQVDYEALHDSPEHVTNSARGNPDEGTTPIPTENPHVNGEHSAAIAALPAETSPSRTEENKENRSKSGGTAAKNGETLQPKTLEVPNGESSKPKKKGRPSVSKSSISRKESPPGLNGLTVSEAKLKKPAQVVQNSLDVSLQSTELHTEPESRRRRPPRKAAERKKPTEQEQVHTKKQRPRRGLDKKTPVTTLQNQSKIAPDSTKKIQKKSAPSDAQVGKVISRSDDRHSIREEGVNISNLDEPESADDAPIVTSRSPETFPTEQHQGEASESPMTTLPSKGKQSKSKADRWKAKQPRVRPTREPTRDEAASEDTRGGTVPITVHRLANISALDALSNDSFASSNEADSADELSARTKYPNQGGVNPADVLNQISREALEKTLTTIKNSIENESNPARRAECVRKRKAVEAFGAELEGRLFDMSEVLDSNFILTWQLKKAKREMTGLRNRLLQIRQQKEEIALHMDEVRRKHVEEEETKMARTTINNSLHNLELAIDRSLTHNTGEQDESPSSSRLAPTAGLEFLLRTVGEDVSSVGLGSQGGPLNQIKAFNARLEAVARKLEG